MQASIDLQDRAPRLNQAARADAVAAARRFVAVLAAVDRQLRREQRSVPSASEHERIASAFWDGLMRVLDVVEPELDDAGAVEVAGTVRAMLSPWLMRSRFWNRCLAKPHGYAGDYQMLELMYELESHWRPDPMEPAAANLLEELGRSVHSVQAVWHRRRWFAGMIASAGTRRPGPLRVLDIACGGSRYLRDTIYDPALGEVTVTFIDQDPTALSYLDSWLPARRGTSYELLCAPVKRLREALAASAGGPNTFDLVLCTGLLDYLDDNDTRALLTQVRDLTGPGGTVAVSNFSPADRSRLVKEWIVDWPLRYRTGSELVRLFPPGLSPTLSRSPDGGLLYAKAVRPPLIPVQR